MMMWKNLTNDKRDKIYSVILLCASILFYMFFALYDGVVIGNDSPGYIEMSMHREPFYCTFLAILRAIFNVFRGGNSTLYLTAVVYIQSLLAALAAWCLTKYLKKEFRLSYFQSSVVLAIPLATSFLCRFAAKRASMYSNSILTEGIACSLFLIFIRYLLEYYYKRSVKCLVISGILSFVLISTRKQMYITLILLVIMICWSCMTQQRIKQGILTAFICTFCILFSNVIFDNGYNYLVRGELVTHSKDNRFMATMVIYTSERSYGESITDKNVRYLFYEIYDVCDAKGYLGHSAEHGWANRVDHYGKNYDHIQLRTMVPTIQEYVQDHYDGSEIYLEQKSDEITDQIIKGLFPKVWTKVFSCFIDNFIHGLITTVAKINPILNIYSFIIYLLYWGLLILHIRKQGLTPLVILAIFTMFSIVINVSVVSMVIFTQTRYTIYNMPIFYITLWIMFINIKSKRKDFITVPETTQSGSA